MANWLIQNEHLLQIIRSPLGEGDITPIEFSGYEIISKAFNFTLDFISGNTEITPEKIIGNPIVVKINSNLNKPRIFHGLVKYFAAGSIKHGMRSYTVELAPAMSFLEHASDCRIFQNKSVIDIVKTLIGEYKYMPIDISGLTKSYPERDYCTQYRETALKFINRILQEEGIFYFFKHEESKHTLVLADKSSACKMCEPEVIFSKGSGKERSISNWQKSNTFYSGKYEQNDFNFETPHTSLHTQQQGSARLEAAQKYGLYDYPGRYEDTGIGKNYTQHQFNAEEAGYEIFTGSGNYESFTAGHKITATDLPVLSDQKNYLITRVDHYATDHTYLGTSGGGTQHYRNNFCVISDKVELRPAETISKPIVHGPQTAFVVGPKGKEIYTDNYGRVKVQFHWDRKGEKNEYSSCWLRVSQVWAGKNWGAVFIPRIGHEVIVQFLNGDPDRPIITGSVYNSDNTMPYQYPFDETKSGIKSHSSKGGGAADANELYFEDKIGSEEFHIHAQKDFNQIINNNKTETIKKDSKLTVGNNLTVEIAKQGVIQSGETLKISAAKSIKIQVGSSSILLNTEGVFIDGTKVNVNQ